MEEKYENILIAGSDRFIKKTKRALDFIKNTKSKTNYLEFVQNHIGQIIESQTSGINVYRNPPVFGVGHKTWSAKLSWYASCIVHDAHHTFLYYSKRPHSGKEAEESCLEFQILFLKDNNDPDKHIPYLRHLIDDHVDYYSPSVKRTW